MNWCWDESFEFYLGIYFFYLLKYLYVFVNVQEEIKIDIFMIIFLLKLDIFLVIILILCNNVIKICYLFNMVILLIKYYEGFCMNLNLNV